MIANNVVQYSAGFPYTHFKFPNGYGYSVYSYKVKGMNFQMYQMASAMGVSSDFVTSEEIQNYLSNNYEAIQHFFNNLEIHDD